MECLFYILHIDFLTLIFLYMPTFWCLPYCCFSTAQCLLFGARIHFFTCFQCPMLARRRCASTFSPISKPNARTSVLSVHFSPVSNPTPNARTLVSTSAFSPISNAQRSHVGALLRPLFHPFPTFGADLLTKFPSPSLQPSSSPSLARSPRSNLLQGWSRVELGEAFGRFGKLQTLQGYAGGPRKFFQPLNPVCSPVQVQA
jgi:hypothetical protein